MVKKIGTREAKAKAKVPTKRVEFEFPFPEAKEVYLVGEFNQWDPRANIMKKDRDEIWRAALSLKPGRYEYRLLVDGNWENAPSCSGCVPNEFGSQNCVKIVG
jgi:1,4-alpha-glucan branching enzyme